MRKKIARKLAAFLALVVLFTTFGSDYNSIGVRATADVDAIEQVVSTENNETTENDIWEPQGAEQQEAAAEEAVEPEAEEAAPAEEEAPAEEPQVEEAPAEEPQVEEAPAEEPQVEEAPAEEPQVEEAPAEEPAAEEVAPEEQPAEEPQATENKEEETPAADTPAEETPAEETPAEEVPAEETPAEEVPTEETPAEEAVVPETPEETPEVVEARNVTVSYKADKGGNVSRESETIDINDETAAFEGATATAWNGYQFTAWVDSDGDYVSNESTLVPADITEDETFTAQFEKLDNMPEINEQVTTGGMNVSVFAEDGIFPEGTTVSVRAISDSEAIDTAKEALGETVSEAKGVDITFYDANGNEIQPADGKYVHVSITLEEALEGDDFAVVHDHDGVVEEIADASADGAEFDSNQFSVYVVASTDSEIERKVHTFIFETWDGTNWVKYGNEQFVKTGDTLNSPGIPTLGANQEFKGWFIWDDENNTFGEPAKFGSQESKVINNETTLIRAKIVTTYYVTFKDEPKDKTLPKEAGPVVQVKSVTVEPGQPADMKLDVAVTPKEDTSNFTGWTNLVDERFDDGAIIDASDEHNRTLFAEISKGYWVRFDENDGGTGGGASYTKPEFVKEGDTATRPATDPTRSGFTFEGWFTEAVCADEFDFSTPITGPLVLYAKWVKSKAPFTVVIWKQNIDDDKNAAVEDKKYDYDSTKVIEGAATGATVDISMFKSSTELSFEGFSYARYEVVNQKTEEGNTISPKGTTVVNVYYDRDLITYTFYTCSINSWGNIENKVQYGEKFTGLYQQSLEKYNYEWPKEKEWHETDAVGGSWGRYALSGVRMTFLAQFSTTEDIDFYSTEATHGNYVVSHYKQELGGGYPATPTDSTPSSGNSTFYFSNKYMGFTVKKYSFNNKDPWNDANDGGSVGYTGDLHIRYERNKYDLSLVSVKEKIDPADTSNVTATTPKVEEVYKLLYEADIATQKDAILQKISELEAPEGYELYEKDGVFIFADETGTEAFDWTKKMPADNDTRAFVIWHKAEYNVRLDFNVDGDDNIETKTGYDQVTTGEGASANFWVWHGETVSRDTIVNGFTRPGYELVGWFNKDHTPYDYSQVTKPIILYAKWRKVGEVKIIYQEESKVTYKDKVTHEEKTATVTGDMGSNRDGHAYAADSTVVVTAGPTSLVDEDGYTGYTFVGWEILDKNGNPVKEGDVVKRYYPNNNFKILDDYITQATIDGVTQNAVILRAKYERTGQGTDDVYTTVTYDPGEGTGTPVTITTAGDDNHRLRVNEAIPLWKRADAEAAGFARPGYRIIGWNTSKENAKQGRNGANFIDIEFEEEYTIADNENNTDNTNDNTLYAVWEQITGTYVVEYYKDSEDGTLLGTSDLFTVPENTPITLTDTASATQPSINAERPDHYNDGVQKTGTVGEDGKISYIVKADVPDEQGRITPQVIKVVYVAKIIVTVTGNTLTQSYNGLKQSVEGFTYKAVYAAAEGEAEVDVEGFTLSLKDGHTAKAEGTDVKRDSEGNLDSYPMNLTEDDFSYDTNTYTDVTMTVNDGSLTITPIEAQVTINGTRETHVYDKQPHTVTGYVPVIPEGSLYTVDDFSFTGEATATRTNVIENGDNTGITYMGLKDSQFTNNNGNFSKVTFTINDGYIQITPVEGQITVTITGHNATNVYDTKKHEVNDYDVRIEAKDANGDALPYDENDFEFTGSAHAERTDVAEDSDADHKTYMGLTPGQFKNTNSGFKDGIVKFVIAQDGYQQITPATATVKIKGHNQENDFDNKKHEVDGYDVDEIIAADSDGNALTYTEDDFTFTGSAHAERTYVAEDNDPEHKTYMGLTPGQFENTNSNFDGVSFVIEEDGYQQIKPVDITVNITGHNNTVDYDGQKHSVDDYDFAVSGGNALPYTENDFKFTGSAHAERTDVVEKIDGADDTDGQTDMGLTSDQFENINTNYGTVTFVIEKDGFIKIEPINYEVLIIGNHNESPYDGNPHTVSGYEADIPEGSLYKAEYIDFTGTAEATRTNVDDDADPDHKTYMGLKQEQFSNNSTNFNEVYFGITDGYQQITPVDAKVKIVGNKVSHVYDGDPHTASGYTVDIPEGSPYKEEFIDFSGTAEVTRTNVVEVIDGVEDKDGKSEMGLKSGDFKNNSANFNSVEFEIDDGYVLITPIDEIIVTINGKTGSDVYDSKEHITTGYDVIIPEGSKYTEADFEFSGTAEAKRTNVVEGDDKDGKTEMGLTADQFTNQNGNFNKVTFDVKDGYQEILPVDVVVTIVGNKQTVPYNGKEQSVTGYEITCGNAGFSKDDIKCKEEKAAKGTDVLRDGSGSIDSYPMGLTEDLFSCENDNFKVSYDVTDGSLTIIPLEVTVDIVGNQGEEMYDGKEKVVTGYTVNAPSASGEVSGGDAIDVGSFFDKDKVKFTPDGSITLRDGEPAATGILANTEDKPHYPMHLAAGQFSYDDPNLIVSFNVTDGKLVIKDRINGKEFKVTAITDDDTKEFTGKTWTGADYTYRVVGEAASNGVLGAILDWGRNLVSDILGVLNVHAADGDTTKEIEIDGVKFFVSGLRVDVKARNVGAYKLDIVDLDKFKVVDELGNDVTKQFQKPETKIGTLTITPKEMTVTSLDATKVYDGSPLTNHSAVAEPTWGEGDEVAYNFTGTQTEVGVSDNTFTVVAANDITDLNNYKINYKYGKLEVTKAPESPDPNPNPNPDPDPDKPKKDPVDKPPKKKTPHYDDGHHDDPPQVDGDHRVPDNKNVLGAKREEEEKKVLGARRGGTEDATNTSRVIVLLIAAGAVATLLATTKKRKGTGEEK